MGGESGKREFGIRSVEKALTLLDLLLASPEEGIRLHLLASRAKIPPATARNLLRTMEKSFHAERENHLYRPGRALVRHFRRELFNGEEKLVLAEYVRKISTQCGETCCLFCGEVSASFPEEEGAFPKLTETFSHGGSKGVVAGEEAARASLFSPSPARALFLAPLREAEGSRFREGKACGNALWSLCFLLDTGLRKDLCAVLALFLPAGRATGEKRAALKDFLLSRAGSGLFR